MAQQPEKNNEGLRTAVASQRGGAAKQPTNGSGESLNAWLVSMKGELARALPAGGLSADRLARIVLTEVRRTPLLAKCTKESFAGALMTCAQLGLEPGVATGEAYLLPFRNGRTKQYEVTLIIGYPGMAKLYWQSPLAKSLDAQVVYEKDEFDYCYGLEPKLVHKPALGERGSAIAYYAVATLTSGGSAFVVLSPTDVNRIRERSKAKDEGPWKTDYDQMARKTAVRQLFKLLPKSPQLQRALSQDESIRTDAALDIIDEFPEDRIVDVDGSKVDSDTGEVHDDAQAEQQPDKPPAVDAAAATDPNGPTEEELARINAEAAAEAAELSQDGDDSPELFGGTQ